MDGNARNSKGKGKGRGKYVLGEDVIEMAKQTRDPNFTETDTFLLLNVMEIVKGIYGLKNYGFKKNEWVRVEVVYNDKTRIKRTAEVLKNRWKTLRSDFGVVKALTNRSGWGWDSQTHLPIPPSEEEWEVLVQGDASKRYGKFKSKKFPWFDQLEKMCGKDISTGYGQVTTESSHQIRHEWCDVEGYEANSDENYGDGFDNDYLRDAMNVAEGMSVGNATDVGDATRVEDVTDVGDTNPGIGIEDIDAYDLANFLRTFDNSSSDTLTNDRLISNSGHGSGTSDKRKGCDVGRGPTSRAKRFRAAAAEKQRAVDKIIEQNSMLIEQTQTFLQQQQARTDVFNGWGINRQHKIPLEIDVKLKSLDPKLSTEDYLDIRTILRNPAASDDFMSLEDTQIWDFISKRLREYRTQRTPFNSIFNPYAYAHSQSNLFQQPPI